MRDASILFSAILRLLIANFRFHKRVIAAPLHAGLFMACVS